MLIVVFMAMIAALSGCAGQKSSVDLWSESLDEMKNGSFSFYKRSAALSVPDGTYDYIDVIKEIKESDWSENLILAQSVDGAFRLLFVYDNSAVRVEGGKSEMRFRFDGQVKAYESVDGLPWRKLDEAGTETAYKKVLMSTVNVVDMDGSMIHKKVSGSILTTFTAQFNEVIQVFRNRLLLGAYAQGEYNKLKSSSGWLFCTALTLIIALFSFISAKIYHLLIYKAPVRYVTATVFSAVAGLSISIGAGAIATRPNNLFFVISSVLALIFFIAAFFQEDERILSGIEGLISLLGGFVFGVLLATNFIMTLVAFVVIMVIFRATRIKVPAKPTGKGTVQPHMPNPGGGGLTKPKKGDTPIINLPKK
jgi:hypothetical protein